MFIAHLAKEGIAHTTIKVYLAAICYLHVSVGMHQTYSQQLSPYLELVMKGIKKEQLHGTPHLNASASPLLPASSSISTQY